MQPAFSTSSRNRNGPWLAGGVGFEPTGPYGTGPPIFRIGAIDLSAIPPQYTHKRTAAYMQRFLLAWF